MLRKIKIGARLATGYLIVIGLMTVIAFTGIRKAGDLNSTIGRIVDDSYPNTLSANDIVRQVGVVSLAIRNALLMPDPTREEEQFHRIGRAEQRIDKDLDALAHSIQSAQGDALLKEVAEQRKVFAGTVQKVESLLHSGQRELAVSDSMGDLHRDNEAYSKSVERLVSEQTHRMDSAASDAKSTYHQTIDEILATSALAVLSGIVISLLVTGSITRPLSHTNRLLHDIAEGEGDLTQRLDAVGRDEVAELATNFNKFVVKLQAMVQRIMDATTQLATASEELSVITEQSSRCAETSRTEAEQVASAMHEMAATVQQVAQNTVDAAGGARHVQESANHGHSVVTKTVDAIDSLASNVENAAMVTRKLAEESANIGTVLDVIKGITEKTNLLSLNAAIEAARAGEQGRGFAVVAGEVRNLAQRTQDSTLEIESMIERLQAEAAEVVKAIETSRTQAEASVEQASEAGAALQAITRAVETIADMNTQIASAAEQQSTVAEEINRNINNIGETVELSATSSEQAAGASTELAQLAVQLNELVGHFKT